MNFFRAILVWPFIKFSNSYSFIVQDIERAIEYGKPSIPGMKFKSTFDKFNKLTSKDRSIRNIIFFRLKSDSKLKSILFLILFPIKNDLEIQGQIGGGLQISHGHGTVVLVKSAGYNLTLWQGVTIGKNQGGCPTIGNNVKIYTNSVVCGDILIGNNVSIAAGTVVMRDIPDDSLVFGNPCIIKQKPGR